jgi:peptidoglycan/xylan/chitin deacetylase (PgdA/CDA1 family)
MTESGLCEIASHGHMHRRLVGLEGRRLYEELELSRQIIRKQLGSEPVAYFYPLGAYDVRSAGEVEQRGYRAGFRASGAPVALGASSSFWIPRTSVFHDDGEHIGYYFSERFLGQVRAAPTAKQNTAKHPAQAPVL